LLAQIGDQIWFQVHFEGQGGLQSRQELLGFFRPVEHLNTIPGKYQGSRGEWPAPLRLTDFFEMSPFSCIGR
jgi:hypothetical protein